MLLPNHPALVLVLALAILLTHLLFFSPLFYSGSSFLPGNELDSAVFLKQPELYNPLGRQDVDDTPDKFALEQAGGDRSRGKADPEEGSSSIKEAYLERIA
ncbi:hypothetical protein B0T19DRAFT_488633 [Cercophora scortea]|uniref:Uncharacterized protein n=1 Tax=Cercophora scortea TaxID=314031 RepID=A0AAE0I395_9PEZI|nr:hypothetical protein B0T19DRAFT_488633 [Cercophora scortea]